MTFPVIRLEVERMQHTIKTALTQYEMQLDEDIQAAVDLYCSSDAIKAVIYKTAQEEIDDAIQKQIRDFFRFGRGKEAIRRAVDDVLNRDIE